MRLIDADMLLEILEREEKYHSDLPQRADGVRDAIMDVISAPTVDAVPVVRCRDCKHGSLQSNETKRYHCLEHNAMMEPHYYCILGERPQYNSATYHCTKCGTMWEWHHNFCPHCGADMRQDGEQHD